MTLTTIKTFNMIKKYLSAMTVVALAALSTGCNGWLGEESPGSTKLEDFFTSGAACIQTINGCYTPLMWEFNNSYFSEWYFGDIASDDALKGGQNIADGPDAYDIDNFKVNANNDIVLQYYRAKYQGIIRCNLALEQIARYEPDETLSPERKNCLLGEAHFLRALYYFQLVRVFGGVPLIDEVLDSSSKWLQPRASAEEVYAAIIADFEAAESMLYEKADYEEEDLGRATKGAATAYLCKANLYAKNYDEAYSWGQKFYNDYYLTGKYSLCQNYADNFTLAGENGPESVFEVQYADAQQDPTGDYGEGFGFTRGSFTPILTRPRMSSLGSNGGWGWDHPTLNLYNEFEQGDPRREATIGVPSEEEQNETEVMYLGSPYYNNKTCMSENGTFPALGHDSRGGLNRRDMRASDALLLFAEAALEAGKDLTQAKEAVAAVRLRAGLTEPYKINGQEPDFRTQVRHERRVELAMEGHRWFDLVRWGIAADVMDRDTGTYGSTESDEARAEMAKFIPGKHELFPIPAEEIALNPMAQNPGY